MTKKGKAVKRGACAYCGRPIDRRATTCSAHSDLPKLDPRYAVLDERMPR